MEAEEWKIMTDGDTWNDFVQVKEHPTATSSTNAQILDVDNVEAAVFLNV